MTRFVTGNVPNFRSIVQSAVRRNFRAAAAASNSRMYEVRSEICGTLAQIEINYKCNATDFQIDLCDVVLLDTMCDNNVCVRFSEFALVYCKYLLVVESIR